jgi:hypothetical protein
MESLLRTILLFVPLYLGMEGQIACRRDFDVARSGR